LSAAASRFHETAQTGRPHPAERQLAAQAAAALEAETSYRAGIKAPLSGLVLQILVKEGDRVQIGDAVAIMESMKMEQTILAEAAGVVVRINAASNTFIEMDADLLGLD
jgi:acetyl-CoA/propionyl-CoA carboxylase biotin carboxyl carrier protein